MSVLAVLLTAAIGGVVAVAITAGVLYVLDVRARGESLPIAITRGVP